MQRQQKFGIDLLNAVQETYLLDAKNDNTKWANAISKEMKNVHTSFNFIEDDANIPIGFQQIRCHLVFDIKIYFTHKARLVVGGHTTEVTEMSNYSSIVSRESVRIVMVVAALHSLNIEDGGIQNAYLIALCLEKIYTVCGPEFGPDLQGKRAIVVRVLYGLRSLGKAFRNHLTVGITELG